MSCLKIGGFVCFLQIMSVLFSQHACAQYFRNPSFEGSKGRGISPSEWSTCTRNSTPDTQPGAWEVTTAPSDGNSYMGIVTRGNLGPYANQNEDAESRMIQPLLKDQEYHFTIDLAHSTDFGHDADGEFLFYDTPAKLQVIGGTVECDQREVLWESPPIDHTEWKTYIMDIRPQIVNVSYTTLRATFVGNETYFGNILIDNITNCTIDLELLSDTVICERSPFLLSAFFEGASYLWQDGSTNASFKIDTTGVYSVAVSNECVTKNFDIDVTARNCICDTALPIETIPFDTLVCEFAPVEIDASTPGGSYLWNDGMSASRRTIVGEGLYTVEVSNGCDTESFEFEVETEACRCDVAIPNIFTPNGDGKNDFFEIEVSRGILEFSLQIYNREGIAVFISDAVSNQWDGTIEGTEASSGVYYWNADIGCVDGVKDLYRSYNGTITLLR